MVDKILLAQPRGFCAGVDRAITIVENAIEVYGKPVYVRHHIVHNEHVVRELEKKGAIFTESLDDIPKDSTVVFSAHGVPPSVRKEAEEKKLHIIDATCPLVTKVHFEARRYDREGYTIILIGHKGHQEVIGTMGHAKMMLVENVNDVATLKVGNEDKLIYLTQTTLSFDDTARIIDALKKKFPNMEAPPKEDICYATQNRQNAVKELSKQADLILVIGSKTSSNSNRLVDTAMSCGVPAYLIADASRIKSEWFDHVNTLGITSGASAPENLVQDVIERVRKNFPQVTVEDSTYLKENIKFALPKEVDLMKETSD